MSLTKVRVRNARNWGGLSLWRLIARTWAAMGRHDTLSQAAVVAYYAMLSMVPLLGLSLAAAVDVRAGVGDEVNVAADRFLPTEAAAVVRDQVQKMQADAPTGLLSASAVILLWSASSLFVSVMDATSAAYGVRDSRPWWRRRLMAVALTLAVVALMISASVSAVAWPSLFKWFGLDHIGGFASAAATAGQWLVVVVALLAAFGLAHYFGPDVNNEWQWVTPGSALGVIVLIGASFGFRWYLQFGTSYSATYGALAGVVLMLLWLYLAALALLVGAEVNCVIAQAGSEEKEG
jgi:membrane protein